MDNQGKKRVGCCSPVRGLTAQPAHKGQIKAHIGNINFLDINYVAQCDFCLKTRLICIIRMLYSVWQRNMQNDDFCQSCHQKDNCQEVYRRLGGLRGPSVVPRVVLALLIPMLVFIVSLAFFEKILAKATTAGPVQTAVGLAAALAVTFICMLVTRAIDKRISEKRQRRDA
jgi:hypothetical protein